MADKRSLDSILMVILDIKYNVDGWIIALKMDDDRPYLQIICQEGVCNVTGEPLAWSGRKWMLSYYMTDTEIVRTAHKAIEAAVLHEMNEKFLYKNVAVCDPHISVDALVGLMLHTKLDSRD